MATKPTGISRELLIHPGETIADTLEERGMTQAELAARCGVSAAYISSVIAGKKDISASFAAKLEYALGVDKRFWLTLQANYDAELLEYTEKNSITEEEQTIFTVLSPVYDHLVSRSEILPADNREQSILALRRFFRVSSLCQLKDLLPVDAGELSLTVSVDPYLLGPLLQMRKG